MHGGSLAAMRTLTLGIAALVGCARPAPSPTPRPAPPVATSSRADGAEVAPPVAGHLVLSIDRNETVGDAEVRCAKALGCAHAFVELLAPPHPCEGQGTRCTKEVPPPTGLSCQCAECSTDADCAAGSHCETEVKGCPNRQKAGACQPGSNPGPVHCPAPS